MTARIRALLSPPMLVAMLALVVSLAGVSYAAVTLPKNSVGAKQLKKDAVSAKKVKDGSLVAADFAAGQLPAGAQGPKGDQGSAASAILVGVASTTGGSEALGLSGQVGTGSADDIGVLSPNAATVVRDFSVQVTAAPPAGSTRNWRLWVNGVPTLLCSITAGLTACTSSVAVSVPPSATMFLQCLVSGVGAGAAKARWGMTVATS